ncbi:DgyrCDS6939 [Dimorphilus gyrociliatus]|uniref:DgyrCDS6939 n=1 Tax=Dimorphilus gyrociliatus TaxID=2664684 RepID=A0A7I8VS75_9ANNE|nr:DgyrCDS6939 [Dimorphilus gyrociliatus]
MATSKTVFVTLILLLPTVCSLSDSNTTYNADNSTLRYETIQPNTTKQSFVEEPLGELNAKIVTADKSTVVDDVTTQGVKISSTVQLSTADPKTSKKTTVIKQQSTRKLIETTTNPEITTERVVKTDPPYIVQTLEPKPEKQEGSSLGIIIGCICGIIFLIIIIVIIVCYARYKKRKSSGSSLFMKDDKLHYFMRDKEDSIYRNSDDRRSYRAKKGEVEILETSKMDPVGVRRSETTRSDNIYRKKKRAPAPPGPLPYNSRKSVRSTLASVSSNEPETELTTFKTNANEEVDKPLLTQQVRNGDNHEYCELDDYDRTKNPFLSDELDDNRNVK